MKYFSLTLALLSSVLPSIATAESHLIGNNLLSQIGPEIRREAIVAKISGCELEDMNFARPESKEFNSNTGCEILHSVTSIRHLNKTNYMLYNNGEEWVITKNRIISTPPSNGYDILWILPNVRQDICMKLNNNKIFEIDTAPNLTYIDSAEIKGDAAPLNTHGKMFGCFSAPNGQNYYLHTILKNKEIQ